MLGWWNLRFGIVLLAVAAQVAVASGIKNSKNDPAKLREQYITRLQQQDFP